MLWYFDFVLFHYEQLSRTSMYQRMLEKLLTYRSITRILNTFFWTDFTTMITWNLINNLYEDNSILHGTNGKIILKGEEIK